MTDNKDTVRMVDVSEKKIVHRHAEAQGEIVLHPKTIAEIKKGSTKKGNVIAVSEIAGIMAAKRTAEIIPLCHQIPLASIQVGFTFTEDRVQASCSVTAVYVTGVEMEALVGVAASLLSIWDMVKYLEKDERGQYPTARLQNIRVTIKEKEDLR
jgi:cyclic pyranopterin phosphate synthase